MQISLGNYKMSSKYTNMLENFISSFRTGKKTAILLIIMSFTAFFLVKMQDLRFDNSNEIWFQEGDPALERIELFTEHFGNDDFVVLAYPSEKFFDSQSFSHLQNLVKDIKKNVPYVRDVTWLGNAEYVDAGLDGLVISDFTESKKYLSANQEERLAMALAEKNYRDALISIDGKTAAIVIELRKYPAGSVEPRSEVTLDLRKILEKKEYLPLDIVSVGQPLLYHDYNMLSLQESAFFFGLCILIQCAMLFWIGGGLRAVLMPLCVVILSVIWTLGLIQVLGFTLNLFVILIPVLLICVGIGDSMHIITIRNQNILQNLSPKKALQNALRYTTFPCLLTSLTTAVGFLGFCATNLRPFQEMGIYAALGCIVAFILSLSLSILFYGTEKNAKKIEKKKKKVCHSAISTAFLSKIYILTVTYPKQILVFFAVLSGISLYGLTLLEVETATIRMFSKETALRQAYDFVDERLGGTMSVEIVLDTGKAEGVKDPEFLHALNQLEEELQKVDLVSQVSSVVDLLKKMNQSINAGEKEAYVLPKDKELVAQYLLLYEMSDGRNLDKVISFDGSVARMTTKTQSLDTKEVRYLSNIIEEKAKELFGNSVEVIIAGNLDWTKSMTDLLAQGQKQSFLTALLLVSTLMCLALRSFRLGILSMLPNIFPVLISLGLMGFMGIRMDMALMSFSAIIIGVVVDDTIHFLLHYNEAFKKTASYEMALKQTLLDVGRPILYTTLTMVFGFSVLLFSQLSGVAVFGGLACFAFAWALLAEYFFVPTLLLVFRPLGKSS